MKSISPQLAAHLAGEGTSLAMCWKLTRRDGTVMGFTEHDKNILFESVTYQASSGFTSSAIASSGDMAVGNLDVEGVLDSGAITEADILAGKYDFAEVEIFQVNYGDLSQGALKLRRGWLGEVSAGGGKFVAEIRGLAQRLSRTIGELYSPSCRAKLGDARCGVDLAPLTVTGTITGVTDSRVFADSSRAEEAGHFNGGKITFTSGPNNGISMEVKEYTPGNIALVLPMPYAVAAGNSYSMEPGCDKTFATCRARYDNAVNFRGEPHVPGTDRMLQTSTARVE